jgi:peptidoglycan/LPS O-acetylase OafA/YrhL
MIVSSVSTISSIPNPIKHRNNFNFLRLLLAVLVLLSHAPELMDGDRHREILTQIFHTISFGELAVDGFFLLSGYLIIQSWQRSPQLFTFLKKRVLRIYPGFIVATLISAFIVGPLGSGSSFPEYISQFNPVKFISGIFLLQTPIGPPVFVGQPQPQVNGSLWTIGYEFRCYILVAMFGLLGIIRRRRIWLIFSIFVFLSAAFPTFSKIYLRYFGRDFGDLMRFLSFFCAGGCFYLFRDKIHYNTKWALGLLPIVILSLFESDTLKLTLPTIGAYIFFWFAFLDFPSLNKIGTSSDISYGLYLYGWPAQKLLYWYLPLISPWLGFILVSGISAGCGLLSWKFVEKPFLNLKKLHGEKNSLSKGIS